MTLSERLSRCAREWDRHAKRSAGDSNYDLEARELANLLEEAAHCVQEAERRLAPRAPRHRTKGVDHGYRNFW